MHVYTSLILLYTLLNLCIEHSEDAPLPEGWTELIDEATGKHYYYNTLDGSTTFDRPSEELE